MKKLVSIEELSGWRKPTQLEENDIQVFKRSIFEESVYYLFWFTVLLIVAVATVIATLRYISWLGSRDLLAISIMLVALTYELIQIYKKCNIVRIDYREILNGYSVIKCGLHHMECKRSIKFLMLKCDILAYVHSDDGEYCETPIKVEDDIEELFRSGIKDDFLLLKLGDKYKIIHSMGVE